MNKIQKTSDDWISFHCPGCGYGHGIPITAENPKSSSRGWLWNRSFESPTIFPSIAINASGKDTSVPKCHLFISEGKIQFLSDCTHHLAGKTIGMEDVDI